MTRAMVVTWAALMATAALAQAPDAGTHPLAGRWKLDLEASSDPKDVLDHFEANFFIRRFARSVAPLNVIEWKGDRFELEVKAVGVYHRSSVVHLDGATSTSDEMFGSPYTFTSTRDGDAVVSTGTVKRQGVDEGLAMRRTVEPDGTMRLQMTITPRAGPPLHLTRVFKRVP